jgi:hypothetical protein
LEVSVARIISPAVPAALDAAGAATEDAAATLFVETTAALDATRVTKTVVTELHSATAGAAEVAATIATAAEMDDAAARAVVVAETDAAPPPPKVNA